MLRPCAAEMELMVSPAATTYVPAVPEGTDAGAVAIAVSTSTWPAKPAVSRSAPSSVVPRSTGAGLRSPAAPGSIIAVYAAAARDSYVGVTLAVLFATLVSFLIASVILKASKAPAEDDLDEATHRMEALKGKKSSVSAALIGEGVGASGVAVLATPIKNIVFACDAGMGSSAMGA